jgi:choline dehydrogenase
MYLVRPSELEVNTWQNLLGGAPGSEHWGWDNLFAYMKKSESFTPPSADVLKEGSIEYDAASHGTNGPIHASYPGTILPIVGEWTDTLDWIGIAVTPDAYNGTGWGGFIATSSINPANWTRSYSRVGYIDPLPYRPNLQILPGAMVTKLLFGAANSDGTFNATGVQYQTSKTGAKHTITVNKEVILSGGAIGSPAILMQSGVGPAKMLTTAGVNVSK